MKSLFALLALSLSITASGTDRFGYLNKEDQKYYKNDSFQGEGMQGRVDSTVKEINKVYGELEALKAEVAKLRAEVDALKARQK